MLALLFITTLLCASSDHAGTQLDTQEEKVLIRNPFFYADDPNGYIEVPRSLVTPKDQD